MYLITGAMGCIGVWTLYHLVKSGKPAVSFDLSETRHRLDLLLSKEEQEAITFINGDLTNTESVNAVFAEHGVTHVIHLAALQVPFCRKDPVMGARVNVTGTVNVFEAAKNNNVSHIAYASSIAVYGPKSDYPEGLVAHDAPRLPRTHYGVFKTANEGTAQIYYQDNGITSTAIRPYTVYGLARDQGLTSEPTSAMQAAAKGEDFHMTFGGKMQFHFASDVAQQFIEIAEKPLDGAYAFNMGTPPVAVADVAQMIMNVKPSVKITLDEKELPFPEGFDPQALYDHFDTIYETPLEDGIRQTIEAFEKKLS